MLAQVLQVPDEHKVTVQLIDVGEKFPVGRLPLMPPQPTRRPVRPMARRRSLSPRTVKPPDTVAEGARLLFNGRLSVFNSPATPAFRGPGKTTSPRLPEGTITANGY